MREEREKIVSTKVVPFVPYCETQKYFMYFWGEKGVEKCIAGR
jgi:hypothetical protein